MFADMEMDSVVFKAIRNFQKINKSRGLSEQDKHRLKEAYVKNYMEVRPITAAPVSHRRNHHPARDTCRHLIASKFFKLY